MIQEPEQHALPQAMEDVLAVEIITVKVKRLLQCSLCLPAKTGNA